MSSHYDEEALWTKARLFINNAMDDEFPKTFDERALWASLSLELLGKAALSRFSPVLIAVPTEDGGNLLIASGLIEGGAKFTTIPAHTLYSRCNKAFRPFSEKDAKAITFARNDYLHGGAPAFSPIPEPAWWPRFWAQAVILVHACDKTIEEFVGSDRADVVERHLGQNKLNIVHRLEMLISRARQRLAQHQAGTLPERVARVWATPTDLTVGLSHNTQEICPCCGEIGTLEGDVVIDSEPHVEVANMHDVDAWMDLTVLSDYFSCPKCRLTLEGTELIQAAGMRDTFASEGEFDIGEPDYGND